VIDQLFSDVCLGIDFALGSAVAGAAWVCLCRLKKWLLEDDGLR
jgi:hypothetical protein